MTAEADHPVRDRKTVLIIAGLTIFLLAAVFLLRDFESPRGENLENLRVVREAVLLHVEEVGELPESLEILVEKRYLARMPTDRWGSEIRYERLADGNVKLTSLGADRKPGGFMFKRDQNLVFALDGAEP